ncbi:MAG: SRPBCC family protein [Anaerolineae bacterium]
MINFEHSIDIDKPADVVFAFLANPANETQWQAGLLESKLTTDGQVEVGATGRDTRKFMGREVITIWEVTDFEPNKMFGFKVIAGPVPFRGAYTFVPTTTGTRVTITAQAQMNGLSRLFEPIIAYSGKQQYEKDFLTLKKVLEAPN